MLLAAAYLFVPKRTNKQRLPHDTSPIASELNVILTFVPIPGITVSSGDNNSVHLLAFGSAVVPIELCGEQR